MIQDPAFWSLAAGFAMIIAGMLPMIGRQPFPEPKTAERGCLLVILGIAVVLLVTAVKVLG